MRLLKRHIRILIILCGCFALWNLWITTGYSQEVFLYEAKDMEIVDGSVIVPTDTAMIFYSWGTIRIPIMNLIGNCNISVRIREAYVYPYHVLMQITTPSSIDTIEIEQPGWHERTISRAIEGTGPWQFSFLNDAKDRRLYMDYVKIERIPFTDDVTLRWDPNSEYDMAGYKLYYGSSSRRYTDHADVGNVTKGTLNLDDGKYYIAATAYDTANNESDYSNEVSAVIKIQTGENDLFIWWSSNVFLDTAVAGYRLYWGSDMTNSLTSIDVGLDTCYTIKDALPYRRIFWKITFYDEDGNESSKAYEQHITSQVGDKNLDNRVDFKDLVEFDRAFAKSIGNEFYDMFFDQTDVGIINFKDMIEFDKVFGTTY